MSAQILAFGSQKGGVGKTTTCFHEARAAVLRGLKVLLVDLDPQGNLTTITAAEDFPEDGLGIADVLSSRASETLSEVIIPGIWEGLDLAPTAGESLGVVRDELVIAGAGREGRLKEALMSVKADYDLILIDCPPALDQLTINALTAADRVVIVAEAKLFSSNGVSKMWATIANVKAYYNAELRAEHIIVNLFDAQTVSGKMHLQDLLDASALHSLTVLGPVPKRVSILDSSEAALGLDQWPSDDAKEHAKLYESILVTLIGDNS